MLQTERRALRNNLLEIEESFKLFANKGLLHLSLLDPSSSFFF